MLRKVYRDFVKWDKENFIVDRKKWLGVAELKLKDKLMGEIYDVYYKPTFVEFAYGLKHLIFDKNIFSILNATGGDAWHYWKMAKFLTDSKIIEIKNDKAIVINEEIAKQLIKPLKREEIVARLKKSLGKLRLNYPTLFHFRNMKFKWKAKFDQIPICLDSAIFIIKKILEYIPFPEKFLFIGDDDFISILLGLVEPRIRITVIDIDSEVLNVINKLASFFNLKIETKQIDVRKNKIKEKFIGFNTNPPYTEIGIKSFVRFGLSALSFDGGFCFLTIGEESIEKRWIFLHEFFAKNRLILKEFIKHSIVYPFNQVYPEDKIIVQRLEEMGISYKRNPWMVASFLVLNFVPWNVKRIRYKRYIYSYI